MANEKMKLEPADAARAAKLAEEILKRRQQLGLITARTLGYKGTAVAFTSGPPGTHAHGAARPDDDERTVVSHSICIRFSGGFCACYNVTTNTLLMC